jgi:outer membrane protein TolC
VLHANLVALLQTAERQNAQINLARERVLQSCESKAAASWCCSQKLQAQSRCLQKQVQLRRVSSETLRDVGNTYFDLLAARTLAVELRAVEERRAALLVRAKKLVPTEPGAEVQVKAIEAAALGAGQMLERLHQQEDAASARLAYLLGVEECSAGLPADLRLVPLPLVAGDLSIGSLVEQALATGPGVRETQELLTLAQSALEMARKPCPWLPGFLTLPCGCCPGGQRCFNFPGICQPQERLRTAESQVSQVAWEYEDLRGKLTAGVLESRAAILSGRSQMQLLQQQVQRAAEAYALSNTRLVNNVPGGSLQEVGLAIDAWEGAWRSYVEAISGYNKAQVQLLILQGWNP